MGFTLQHTRLASPIQTHPVNKTSIMGEPGTTHKSELPVDRPSLSTTTSKSASKPVCILCHLRLRVYPRSPSPTAAPRPVQKRECRSRWSRLCLSYAWVSVRFCKLGCPQGGVKRRGSGGGPEDPTLFKTFTKRGRRRGDQTGSRADACGKRTSIVDGHD